MKATPRPSLRLPSPRATLASGLVACALLGGVLLGSPSTQGVAPRSAAPDGDVLAAAGRLATEVLTGLEAGGDPCNNAAVILARGSIRGLQEDFAVDVAQCLASGEAGVADACLPAAFEAFREELSVVLAQYEGRLEACALTGGGVYAPEVDPADFVDAVDHPYFPLPVGASWVYHKPTDEGLEVIEVAVTADVKEILGVSCTVVRALETLEGVVIEDTLDYYAQDTAGNVWYFGELTKSFEDGELVSLDGSWQAGQEEASPGLVFEALPRAGVTYRREFLIGVAEDLATVEALGQTVELASGTVENTVKTLDFNPLEPWEIECKYYSAGVGLVLEVEETTGERTELVSVTLP